LIGTRQPKLDVTAHQVFLARRPRGDPASRTLPVVTAAVLGWTFFTSTVEGQTWWLELPAAGLFAAWALRRPRRILSTAAAAFAVGAALIGVWAIWQGGVPEFSDVGLI
jgi:hypothetical protein